ncbi:MAG: uroporphyrinogen-III synthase [Chroococcidiopsidaceae cyanobacterium CP_BM_RX_35]|nr:uroporphyrinogen-III synthase [Chroococcidiopsidaceae cyanobacterium CP_BM_RX_35]
MTAPRNYASRLSEHIVNQGGLPLLMPTIETCLLGNYTELDNILQRVDEFDWIAFTSRNGIDAFFQRMIVLGLPKSMLRNCQLCAIGKDSERLAFCCGRVDLTPTEPSPEGIVAELSKHSNIQGKTVLVPVPEVVGISEPAVIPKFVTGLQRLGMQVTRVPTYTTRSLPKDFYGVELDLIRQDKIDVIAFSSTAEVESFLKMVNSKNDYHHCAIACFGPYTAANTEKLGMKVSVLAKDYSSFEGFATAIAASFKSSKR